MKINEPQTNADTKSTENEPQTNADTRRHFVLPAWPNKNGIRLKAERKALGYGY